MLGELERKLTALVADGVTTRTHLRVVQAPSTDQPQPGNGVVRVGLSAITPQPVFERGQIAFGGAGDAPTSRRVLPVQFTALIQCRQRPSSNQPSALVDSRALMLDDLSIISHNLATLSIRTGKAFVTAAPDPGFQVLSFELASGATQIDATGNVLTSELQYQGMADIWPPNVSAPTGVMRSLDVVIAPLPLTITADRNVVVAGQTATLRIRDVSGTRLREAGGGRDPLRFALTVVSDLPPAQRGSIVGGEAGVETGFRVVPVTEPETVVTYRAPTGDLGATRLEYVAVHLAAPNRATGIFLGSAAIQLAPGGA